MTDLKKKRLNKSNNLTFYNKLYIYIYIYKM